MSYPISSQPQNRRMHSHVASLSQKKTSNMRVTASLSRGSLILTQIPKFGLVLVLVVAFCEGISWSNSQFASTHRRCHLSNLPRFPRRKAFIEKPIRLARDTLLPTSQVSSILL